MRQETAPTQVTVGVVWLWCVAASLAGWFLLAWAVALIV
jgi:hypothetical protein